jgi:hypothetical protein
LYYQKNPGTKTREAKKGVLARLLEMCNEQGVDPRDTLTEEDVRKWMNITHAEKNMITLIGSGYPVRNAQSILKAIGLKLDRSAPRPNAGAGEGQAVTVTINTPSAATTSISLPEEMADVAEEESH